MRSPFVLVKCLFPVAVFGAILAAGVTNTHTTLAQPKPDSKSADEEQILPGQLPIVALPVELAEAPGLPRRAVTVLYAPANTKYFLFPAFAVADVRLVSPTGTRPLFPHQGKTGADTTGVTDGRVEVTVLDLLRSNKWTALLRAQLDAAEALRGKALAFPDVTEFLDVVLVFTDREQAGKRRVVGRSQLTRALGQDRHDLHFHVHPEDLKAIHGARPNELSVEIAGAYKGEFVEPQFRATLEYTSVQGLRLVGKLQTAPGKQTPSLLVAAGGSGGQEMSVAGLLSEAVTVVIEVPAGDRKEVDPALVKDVLKSLLARASKQVELRTQKEDTVVSFLLSGQLRMTAALGRVEAAAKHFESLDEKQFKSFYEKVSKGEEYSEGGGGLNVLDIVSIGGSGSSRSVTEDQLRQSREDFRRDLKRVREMVTGQIPTVVAMDITQLQDALSKENIEQKVEFRTFRRGSKTMVMRLSFQTLDGSPQVADYVAELTRLKGDVTRLEERLKVAEGRLGGIRSDPNPNKGYLRIGDDVLICWGRAVLAAPQPHIRAFDFQFAEEFDSEPTGCTFRDFLCVRA